MQNIKTNDLAHGASRYKPMLKDIETYIADVDTSYWRFQIIDYLKNPSQSVSMKLMYKDLKYLLLDNDLYYRTIDGVLLKYLNLEEAEVVMCEVQEGICGTHQSAHKRC